MVSIDEEINIFDLSYDELNEYNNQKYIEVKSWKRTPTNTLLKLREGINKELRRRRKDGD